MCIYTLTPEQISIEATRCICFGSHVARVRVGRRSCAQARATRRVSERCYVLCSSSIPRGRCFGGQVECEVSIRGHSVECAILLRVQHVPKKRYSPPHPQQGRPCGTSPTADRQSGRRCHGSSRRQSAAVRESARPERWTEIPERDPDRGAIAGPALHRDEPHRLSSS